MLSKQLAGTIHNMQSSAPSSMPLKTSVHGRGLPICDHFSNIVRTMKPEEASNHKSMSENELVSSVNNALDHGYGPHPTSIILGSLGDKLAQLVGSSPPSVNENFVAPPKLMRVVSPRMAFPLSLMHANDYALYRVTLIGDAAHTVRPLQGKVSTLVLLMLLLFQ